MPIKKRLTPVERFAELVDPEWALVFKYPLVRALTNSSTAPFEASAENLHRIVQAFYSPRWITEMSMNDKIALYLICRIMWKAFGKSILSDQQFDQLLRHMSALTTIDKINDMDGVSLAYRQTFIWDIPAFIERFPRGQRLYLRSDYTRPPVRKRLPKHRTQ